ncbi:HNH endonuclease [Saccharothrix sp. HUAS TT10]|uniref:HNH endonuclease n=1 Tax=Saccharothrix sp. HUAS TT10 TaxID=3447450 RepID=UPI003F6F08FE
MDHRVPGLDHSDENLQAACARCHATKSAREGNEAKARLHAMRKRPPESHPGRRKS